MAGTLKVNQVQLGDNSTAANNFVWQTNADGTAKLARGNVGATTQDILTVDANGLITFTQGKQLTLGTAQNTTSGTSIDFTGIPSWVKRITLMFNGVSLNGTSNIRVQIGSGAVDVSGYVGTAGLNSGSGVGSITFSSGFDLDNTSAAADVRYGQLVFCLVSTNLWSVQGNIASGAGRTSAIAGIKTISGTLDRLRITTVNGTDTFDAGSVNILYEG